MSTIDSKRDIFAVLQSVGQHAQRQSLRPSNGLLPSRAIGHHARQFHDFSDPTAIVLALDFDFQNKVFSDRTSTARLARQPKPKLPG